MSLLKWSQQLNNSRSSLIEVKVQVFPQHPVLLRQVIVILPRSIWPRQHGGFIQPHLSKCLANPISIKHLAMSDLPVGRRIRPWGGMFSHPVLYLSMSVRPSINRLKYCWWLEQNKLHSVAAGCHILEMWYLVDVTLYYVLITYRFTLFSRYLDFCSP